MELPAHIVEEILAALARPRVAAQGADQRVAQRTEQGATVLVTPWTAPLHGRGGSAGQVGLFSVTVRNCSATGIAIVHARAMDRGEQFVVRLFTSGREKAALLCTVAHCRRINPLFHVVGAEFTRLLRENELPPQAAVEEIPRTLSARTCRAAWTL